jgi:hypothetical protein
MNPEAMGRKLKMFQKNKRGIVIRQNSTTRNHDKKWDQPRDLGVNKNGDFTPAGNSNDLQTYSST